MDVILTGCQTKIVKTLVPELDEIRSYVGKQAEPRWPWHAIDDYSGTVLTDVFGWRQDTILLEPQDLSEPCGITRFYTDGWGAYKRHILLISRSRHGAGA